MDSCVSKIKGIQLLHKRNARATTADAEQTTVAAFLPWRGLFVHILWALAKSMYTV